MLLAVITFILWTLATIVGALAFVVCCAFIGLWIADYFLSQAIGHEIFNR